MTDYLKARAHARARMKESVYTEVFRVHTHMFTFVRVCACFASVCVCASAFGGSFVFVF